VGLTSLLFDRTGRTLIAGINGSAARHEAILDNIANADTPGFKRNRVFFEDELKRALGRDGIVGRRTVNRHIPIGFSDPSEVEPETLTDAHTSFRWDENNVDIDKEMAGLAWNSNRYIAFVELMKRKSGMMAEAIRERL